MKHKFAQIFTILTFALLTVALLTVGAEPVLARSGQALFEEAYRLEQEEPHRAIELYRQALKRGLDAKLRRTARIRLNILTKRTGSARRPAAGRSKESAFHPKTAEREMRAARVPAMAIDNFFRGLRLVRGPESEENPAPYMTFWRPALNQSPAPALRNNMVRALLAAGKVDRALALLDEVDPYDPAYGILKADILFGRERTKDARALLLTLAARHDMSSRDKVRVLYLLGRIARDSGSSLGAVRYFRLAARYGDRGQRVRYLSLAAFTLYRANMPLQARGLMRGIPTKHDRNIRLLDLILKIQIDGDKKARQELKSFIPGIVDAVDAGRASFLERRALEIMGRK